MGLKPLSKELSGLKIASSKSESQLSRAVLQKSIDTPATLEVTGHFLFVCINDF